VSFMSAAEFRQNVTIPAVPEQVRAARVFVKGHRYMRRLSVWSGTVMPINLPDSWGSDA
jgi:hypothetical protein